MVVLRAVITHPAHTRDPPACPTLPGLAGHSGTGIFVIAGAAEGTFPCLQYIPELRAHIPGAQMPLLSPALGSTLSKRGRF